MPSSSACSVYTQWGQVPNSTEGLFCSFILVEINPISCKVAAEEKPSALANAPPLLLSLLLQAPSPAADSIFISNAQLEEQGRETQDTSFKTDTFYIEIDLIPRGRRSVCGCGPWGAEGGAGTWRHSHGVSEDAGFQIPGWLQSTAQYLLLTAAGFLYK